MLKLENLPVLVPSPLGFITNVLSPDSLQGGFTSGSLDVTNNSNDNNWRSFNDGDALTNLLLVGLGARSVHLPHDVGHTGLVAHESGHVDRLARVILGEGLNLSSWRSGSLLGKKSLAAVTRRLELPVRLKEKHNYYLESYRAESFN